ncbi:hypothetical protein NPX13_g1710 [Xylaria arbuscula]|uniref:Uncharacterized protein n=1 Tax=Xylaria arbuscula TaxID=114810 RepID=A0A9W8NKK3_9PEZI|nr:hypothetical protein NPX13_g1710 [Xylaria arbuscula]
MLAVNRVYEGKMGLHALEIRPSSVPSAVRTNPSGSDRTESSGHRLASSSTSGSAWRKKKNKQDKNLAAVGSQFWGVQDNDHGYDSQLSFDDDGAPRSK